MKAKGHLFVQALGKFLLGVVILGVLIFLPAGSFRYWNGWLLMGILFIPIFFAGLIMLWRNPDLSLDMLCERIGSNKDYVLQSFRQNADTTFLDYVNSLRIAYVTEELRHDPMQSLRDLFFNAGFRSKTTAYRNFCKYNGQSPSEFKASLNANNPLSIRV